MQPPFKSKNLNLVQKHFQFHKTKQQMQELFNLKFTQEDQQILNFVQEALSEKLLNQEQEMRNQLNASKMRVKHKISQIIGEKYKKVEEGIKRHSKSEEVEKIFGKTAVSMNNYLEEKNDQNRGKLIRSIFELISLEDSDYLESYFDEYKVFDECLKVEKDFDNWLEEVGPRIGIHLGPSYWVLSKGILGN